MLKVSLHYATPTTVSPDNVLGRLDIGYARLDAWAYYKAVMSSAGMGEFAPIKLEGYPRWSASVWDLVARTVCKSLSGEETLVIETSRHGRHFGFIDDMTAVIEHWPDGLDERRATIGTAHIHMGRRKGNYVATFATDVLNDLQESTVFTYKPKVLRPWDLLAQAYGWTMTESFQLPSRPELYTPIPLQDAGRSLVSIDTLSEPALSGITKWIHKLGLDTISSDLIDGPCVTEDRFVEFLESAV